MKLNTTLPEVYTSQGEELTIMEIGDGAKDQVRDDALKVAEKTINQKITKIALVKVERCIVDNAGKIHSVKSQNVYSQTLHNNEGVQLTYKQGKNWGYRAKDGSLITTKGISQIDYFKNYGTRVNILKTIGKAAAQIGDMFTFTDLFMTGGDAPLPLGSAVNGPVGVAAGVLLNVMTMKYDNEIRAMIDKSIYEGMQIAKTKGLNEVKKEIERCKYISADKFPKYETLLISQSTAQDILSGKIINWKEVQAGKDITILYLSNRKDKTVIIETFFIN